MKYSIVFLSVAVVFGFTSLQAVTLHQVDTFDSTVLAWGGGGGGTYAHVGSGGPSGAGDAYYSVSQTAFHLGTKNTTQWTGDYIAAGVTSIGVDFAAFSFTDEGGLLGPGPGGPLMYVLLDGPGGAFASASPVSLVVGGAWQHASFGVTAGDLVYLSGGTGDINHTLTSVSTLLIRHDYATPTNPGGHPNHVTAVLGIDNVEAIPEPATMGLLAFGVVAAWRRRRSEEGG